MLSPLALAEAIEAFSRATDASISASCMRLAGNASFAARLRRGSCNIQVRTVMRCLYHMDLLWPRHAEGTEPLALLQFRQWKTEHPAMYAQAMEQDVGW